jgi:CRISPR-associated endonuclease Csy4
MDHYFTIQVRPDPEFESTTLINAVFEKLHLALAAGGEDLQIGISFPDYTTAKRQQLGDKIRLHGLQAALTQLQSSPWLVGFQDYLTATPVAPRPADSRWVKVRRVQVQSSPERLRRRYMKRHQVDARAAALAIPESARHSTDLPWLQLNSGSTGQRFRLFIDQRFVDRPSAPGRFNSYGISSEAALPFF